MKASTLMITGIFLAQVSCGNDGQEEVITDENGNPIEISTEGSELSPNSGSSSNPKSQSSGSASSETNNAGSAKGSSSKSSANESGKAVIKYERKKSTESLDSDNPDTGRKAVIKAEPNTVHFYGYVSGVFEVTVNGENYASLEDFYSKELAALPLKVKKAGYLGNYDIKFEAQIGYSDFWQGMNVYIAPTEKRGYLGSDQLDKNGQFDIELPSAAKDKSYQVKANKRITLELKNRTERIRLCYNLSAVNQKVDLVQADDPIILANFVTELTSYACDGGKNTGLQIPRDDLSIPLPSDKVAIGSSKDQLSKILGEKDLEKTSTQWCYKSQVGLAKVCKEEVLENCQCFIDYDSNGLVKEFHGIKSEYLAQ